MFGRRSVVAALMLAAAACVAAPEQAEAPKPASCQSAGAMTDLLAMQAAVKQSMVYPLGGGVSIDDVVAKLTPQAQAAKTQEEHLRVLEAFVYALGDHHSHLSTNDQLSPRLVPTGARLWVEQRGGQLVITEVRTTAADHEFRDMGLREGMVITKIDGVAAEQALTPPPATPDRADAMIGFAGRVALAGTRRHMPTITVRGVDGREAAYTLTPPPGGDDDASVSLAFPRADVALIRLHNSIGNSDMPPVFDRLMAQARQAKTVILDLRDTPSGGDSSVAKPLMAWFVDGTRGYQKHENAQKSWIEQVEGRKDRFTGKLIVLIDHWTGSMGEGAAIGLRAAAGAKLVGTPMAGLRGAIEGFDVPCYGVSLRIPIERLYEVNGTPRELAQPDVLVSETELAAGSRDVILQKALTLAP